MNDLPSPPSHLQSRILTSCDPDPDGQRVVVWLRVAVRDHDNPALDVGIWAARQLGVPLLVYHAVSERYPHASDRHHRFILEGARDLARGLAKRGIRMVCHVERPGHRGPVLKQLAATASLVVTDAMPLDPLRTWTRHLATVAPVWTVDSSCIVPMNALSKAPQRAFAFRRATQRLRASLQWPDADGEPLPERDEGPLPFEPVDIAEADLDALIAECAIDHGVAPVPDTPGGSVAGYARWARFREHHLRRYARDRNDPARINGVSRMSAYLHYGHVSPFRIATDAKRDGADKYLDELLIWRELAWHFCHHTERPRHASALPDWARRTLEEHRSDPRTVLPLEDLELGRTGEPLWDAAQRSLLQHGELHNNVRMTWGKAVLRWSRSAGQALARLFELNDRYALDGRDPSSVGGILWCLGGLDRPFSPPQPIFGQVRTRSVARHAGRMALDRYTAHVRRPLAPELPRTLVIGAGIAGCAAAATLARHGLPVVVVDKARGPGGRLASRRSEFDRFDHGLPSFTAIDPRFERQVKVWEAAGCVQRAALQRGRFHEGGFEPIASAEDRWWVTPRTSALCRHILGDLELRTQTRIATLSQADGTWSATATDGTSLNGFDRVLLTVPAPQAVALLEDCAPALAEPLATVRYTPRWVAMVVGASGLSFDEVHSDTGPIGLALRQDRLPERTGPERWVLHASDRWTEAHLEDPPESVQDALTEAWDRMTGATCTGMSVHRWRYARVAAPIAEPEPASGLLLAGDAVSGPRVEDAWLSGVAAAGRILRALRRPDADAPRSQLPLW